MKQTHTLVSIATAWGPKYGGINAFNFDLLIAIAMANWQWLRVLCVVAECGEKDVQSARDQYQIELINLGLKNGSIGKEHAALVLSELQKASFGRANENVVWLGHDRITGAVSIELVRTHGGRSALIHHMSYAHYESFAENSATANTKEDEQTQLFKKANVCLAVGPLLQKSASDMLDRDINEVPMLIPGLAEIMPKNNHNTFVVFVSGRLDASARKVKQAHLAVAGFAHAVHRCDMDNGLPDALRGENEPRLKLRGVELEARSADSPGAEGDLRVLAEQHAKRVINLQALPFTQDRAELFNELKGASVCLMPSWHEGFGLVAWEAIAAGVPIVLSKKSGAYQFLKDQKKEHLVHAIDVKGQVSSPFFADADKEGLSALLIEIAKNHPDARAKALRLREELQNDCRWSGCAQALLKALGWEAPIPPIGELSAPSRAVAPDVSNDSGLAEWMELPTPLWHLHTGLSPSQLLKAEEALIPFAPQRESFLETQLDWATSQTHPICIRLLTGEGGAGKTRLALEMCKRFREEGWAVGFLKSEVQSQAAALVKVLLQSKQAVLVVVDYAETRTDVLLDILAALVSQSTVSPLRVLLLARSSGEWWGQLPSRNSRCEALLDGSATTGAYMLPPLYTQLSERNNAFAQALGAFAKALNVEAPNIQPDLNAEHYGSPLYLQIAALLTLLGEHTANSELLPQSLVRHEQRYWQKITANPTQLGMCAGEETEATLLMSLVTLIGQAPTTNSIESLWTAVGGNAANLKSLFGRLSPLYPGRQGLGALQPDLLGEALIGRQVLGASGEALLDAALGEKARSSHRSHALTVIARLLRHRTDLFSPVQVALTKHFTRCAQELFQVCIQTPSPLSLVAEQSFRQLKRLEALQVAGLLQGNFSHDVLPLAELELVIRNTLSEQAWRRYKKNNPSLDDRNEYGNALINLSVAHAQLGNGAIALECAKQALDIYEQLAKDRPERFEPELARSLSNYAHYLDNAGADKQALDYAKKALEIRERLARGKPKSFEPDWATSLSNYAVHLAKAGESQQALDCTKQALEIRERLARGKPESFEPDWATSLGNYAVRLSETDKGQQALDYSKKALDIYERLAKDKPERFEPDWAWSLGNYADILAKGGDGQQALDCSKEAMDVYERLASEKPLRFESDFAGSLCNYARCLADAGEGQQALDCAKKAVDIYERLAKDRLEKFRADMQIAQLSVALWTWLANKSTLLSVPADSIEGPEVSYAMRPVGFFRQVLQVLRTENTSEKEAGFDAVWDRWAGMSKTQQTNWEEALLIICAYAEVHSYLPAHLSDWSTQLRAVNTRRKGNLPKWMMQVAERKGFSLKVDG